MLTPWWSHSWRPGLDQFHILRHKGSHSTLHRRFGSSVTPLFWGRAKNSWTIPSWMGKTSISIYTIYSTFVIMCFFFFSVPYLVISGAMRLFFALSVVISLDHYLSSNQARSESAQARVPGEKIGVRFKDRWTCKIWQPDNQWSEHVAKVWFPISPSLYNYLRWASAS